ncbi:acyl-CoA dehydrogenase family protein [Amphritea sp. HPY]|uniref:acyl-CoA dehydrogenase family protein n=1 Tax=Amphritea sp. HPY TaxID=3421652 RepID=UPI003D7C6179
MNFDFTDDQKMLRDTVRKFLQNESPLTVAREVLEQKQTHSEKVWNGLQEMGVTSLMLPESCGGFGLGALDLCVVAEELGRQLTPTPLSSTLYLAAQALLLGADETQQQQWLTRIAEGSIATMAAPLDGKNTPLPSFESGELNGKAALVPDALSAEFAVILAANSDNQPVWVVADLSEKTERTALTTIDEARPFGALSFNGTPAQPLNQVSDARELLQQVRNRAAVLFAFEQIGGADAITEISVEYARERKTFGRAIGSYQGIKHKLADIYTGNQMARAHCYYGAWALDSDSPELAIAAAGARVSASRAFNYAAQESIQVHGGMGYTWELDCHLFYRRTRQLALILGPEQQWSERIASELEQKFLSEEETTHTA